MPFWAALAPVAKAVGPALLSGAASVFGVSSQNKANAREAQKNRDFQERMSNTAMTRQRNDMMNAGINPAQVANAGGASTPGGAVAQMENPLEGAVSNARATQEAKTSMAIAKKQSQADFDVKTAQATTIRTQSGLNIAQNKKAYAEEAAAKEQAALLRQQTKTMKALQPGQVQQMQLQNIMTGLGIPAAYNEAQIESFLGPKGRAAVNSLGAIANTAKGVAQLRMGAKALDAARAPVTTTTSKTFRKGQVNETSTTRKGATP